MRAPFFCTVSPVEQSDTLWGKPMTKCSGYPQVEVLYDLSSRVPETTEKYLTWLTSKFASEGPTRENIR